MRSGGSRRRLLVIAVATLGSCKATTGPGYPLGAQAVPATFTTSSVAGLPRLCSGQTFFAGSASLCPGGTTYFLCDGITYTEYDCTPPGSGWALETLSQYDRVASDPRCGASAQTAAAGLSGTIYVESNVAAPDQNAVLIFQYCNGTLSPSLVGRYLTGGSGAADLNDEGVLDADQQVVVNADQTLLFAVNQGTDTIAAFHIARDGSLTAVAGSPFPSGGAAPASVGVSGNILVVANKASDGIRPLGSVAASYATFSIQADGSLRPTGSTFALPAGASPTQTYVPPSGSLVFTTEESGFFRALQLSPSGELTLAPGSPVTLPDALFTAPWGRPRPVWPAGLSASPTQSVLYSGVPNNDSIAALEFTDAGQLSVIGGAFEGPLSNGAFYDLPCWSVVSADGTRLYVANAASDSVSVWDVGTDPRQPAMLQTYRLPGGGNPWGLRLDPTGKLLFVIAPRQIHQVPEGQGQLLHGLRIAADGTVDDQIAGSPVPLPVPLDSNPFGVAVVGSR